MNKIFRHRRLALLLLVGLVLVTGGYLYIQLSLSRPMGEGPAGPAVSGEPFQQIWTDRPVLLLGIGDSITAGLGASSSDRSLFNRLVRNPDDEFPEMQGICLSAVLPNLAHENLAVSGSTSLHHVGVVREQLVEQESDVFGLVVLTTGGNDLIHSYGQRPPREGAMYGASLKQARPWILNFEQRLESAVKGQSIFDQERWVDGREWVVWVDFSPKSRPGFSRLPIAHVLRKRKSSDPLCASCAVKGQSIFNWEGWVARLEWVVWGDFSPKSCPDSRGFP